MSEQPTIRVLGSGGDYEDHPNPNYKPNSELAASTCYAKGVECEWWIDDDQRCLRAATVEVKSRETKAKWLLCSEHAECLDASVWEKRSLSHNARALARPEQPKE